MALVLDTPGASPRVVEEMSRFAVIIKRLTLR